MAPASKYALADESYALSHRGVVPTSYDSARDFIDAIGRIYEPFRGLWPGSPLSCCGELIPITGDMFSGDAHLQRQDEPDRVGRSALRRARALENDANCALLAEVTTEPRRLPNAVALIIGTGRR